MRREMHSSETPARALEPRLLPPLPCGRLRGGAQTNPLTIATTRTLRLVWSLANAAYYHEVVTLMEVNPNGPDREVDIGIAFTI